MSKNVVEVVKVQMSVWRRVAYWNIKATRAEAHARAPVRAHACTQKYVIFVAILRQ